MHFSVLDTVLSADKDGSKFWLKKEYPHSLSDCPFPPKKLFSLSPLQLEERRLGIEQFIQFISQDSEIASGETFNEFFSKAMQETRQEQKESVEINIYLMNGNKVTVPIVSIDNTDEVFQAAMKKIGLNDNYVYYFALFLVSLDEEKSLTVVRKLQDFEAPYLSLQDAGEQHKIVIRKNYWSSKYDKDLLDDRIAMNLLYVQIVDDLDRGWILCTDEEKKKLSSLKRSGSRKEFLKVCKSLKYYGYVYFKPCTCDYPKPNCTVLMCAGDREFSVRVSSDENKVLEGSFQIMRIKSWRLSSLVDEIQNDEGKFNLAFTFEYLFSKEELRWISVISKQAVFMSMCMQGMVDEILREQQNKPIRSPGVESRTSSTSSSKSSDSVIASASSSPSPAKTTKESSVSSKSKPSKKSSNKIKSGLTSKKSGVNEVFENIGDDDL